MYNITPKKQLLFKPAMLSCEDPKGLYHSLGLEANADETDIRRAYRGWIMIQPDPGNGEVPSGKQT